MEREKQDVKRKISKMTAREVKIFKRNEKEKAKDKEEIPQGAIDAYNKIVKKQ